MSAFGHGGMMFEEAPREHAKIFRPQARAILQVICDGFGASVQDSEIQVIPIIPKNVTVHINSYKQADSFELVFDVLDLPFDPQIIRAGAAEIFIFESLGDQRVVDRRHPFTAADPGNVRPRSPVDTLELELGTDAARDTFTLGNPPRIVGTFDDVDIELSDSGKWVTIKGQDYTAFLASIQFPPNASGTARRIPMGKRLDIIVDNLIEEADPDRQLSVAVRGIDVASLPVVGGNLEVAGNKRGISVEQATSYWDVIYKLVERYGFICFVDGLDVVISRPKTITDKDTSKIRRMVWGKNLEHLTMRRHLGKEQAPTIVVRSYVGHGKTLTAEFPANQIDRSGVFVSKALHGKNAKFKFKTHIKESTSISKRGKVKTTVRERDEYQIVDVHGITDQAALQRIAENRYHLLGKAERTVIAKTKDLKDLHGLDLLSIAAGDAVGIEWDEFNIEMLSNTALSPAVKQRHLEARGFQAGVAQTIVKHYAILQGLTRPMRFKEGTIEYDVDSGVSIEMELQDFMVIDGIRPDSGAVQPPTLATRRQTLRKADGKPVGWTAAYQAAQQKRWDR